MQKVARLFYSLFLLALVPGYCLADEYFYVRHGHAFCRKEALSVMERLMDLDNDKQRRAQLKTAIMHGECIGAPDLANAIRDVRWFKTPKGYHYACFLAVDPEFGDGSHTYCASEESITSIEAEWRSRKGDYKIVKRMPQLIGANCKEGGQVFLYYFASEGGWQRQSMVFPKTLEPSMRSVSVKPVQALREGCRGADYQSQTSSQ